jgi:hypothetical protein
VRPKSKYSESPAAIAKIVAGILFIGFLTRYWFLSRRSKADDTTLNIHTAG